MRRYVIPDDKVILNAFRFDKADLTMAHLVRIEALARFVVAWTGRGLVTMPILIVGHTDARGTEQYNDDLGEQRAKTVAIDLKSEVAHLSPAAAQRLKIRTITKGERTPRVRYAKSERQHAINRRVEIYLPQPKRRKAATIQPAEIAAGPAETRRAIAARTRPKVRDAALGYYERRRMLCIVRKLRRNSKADDRYINGIAAWSDPAINSGRSVFRSIPTYRTCAIR